MANNTEGRKVVIGALRRMMDEHPAFLMVAGRWRIFEDESIPTMATDGARLVYNPKWMADKTSSEALFIELHEAVHCFMGHSLRYTLIKLEVESQAGRKLNERESAVLHGLCNTAADLAANSVLEQLVPGKVGRLRECGTFPGYGRFFEYPKGKSMEEYFWKIWKDLQDNQQPEQSGQGSGSGDSGSGDGESGDGDSSGDSNGDGNDDGGGDGDGADSDGDESGDGDGESGADAGNSQSDGHGKGSGSGGKEDSDPIGGQSSGAGTGSKSKIELIGERAEARGIKHGEDTGSIEAADLGDKTVEQAIRDWQTLTEAAIEQYRKSCGNLPGWMQSIAKDMFTPVKADWRSELRRFLTERAKVGTTFSKPNRRRHSPNFLLPAQGGLGAGKIAFLCDTSGSMGEDDMNKGLGAASEILKEFPVDVSVTMFQCDTRLIVDATRVFGIEDFPLTVPQEWFGRGGTDLSGAVVEIGKMPERFKILVIVTDMEWNFEGCPDPGIPVLWLATRERPDGLPFGDYVQMDN